MTRVATTGGDGFLGWHLSCAVKEAGPDLADVPVGEFFDADQARRAVDGADRLIHMAGVNRGSDDDVRDGNILFARQISQALREAAEPVKKIVYSNSIQASLDNVYGQAKSEAAQILADTAHAIGAEFVDIRFPNLFGEHGRPFYNSVVATFCHLLANQGRPEVNQDRELTLLHAQDAADVLLGTVSVPDMDALTHQETVTGLLRRLTAIADTYRRGEIPDVESRFDRDLFNTYRSYTPWLTTGVELTRHTDPRGSFVEMLRSHGGCGQASFSTTMPGITRGQHFHRRKIERFIVVSGEAAIGLRKYGSADAVSLDVSGDAPVAVDMPTGWTHNIRNTGSTPLYTIFWTNELFDPERPDTIAEVV
ncbi:MAG: NAD-dependent epimerase/dehydratase family protein [Propionibacteriaceae bacterium]|nr:NAD-dependent epimerase/dehydratase family protein [Propionibacteriaceae bacterium]